MSLRDRKSYVIFTRQVATWVVIGVGWLQILGYAARRVDIRGIGIASAASPLPLVFTQFAGYETFASSFTVEVVDKDGRSETIALTPELYGTLPGPFSRLTTYGGAISYGPGMTGFEGRAMWQSVLRYGFCGDAPIRKALGLDAEADRVYIHVSTHTAGRDDVWVLEVACPQ